jgi:hypothetical protein
VTAEGELLWPPGLAADPLSLARVRPGYREAAPWSDGPGRAGDATIFSRTRLTLRRWAPLTMLNFQPSLSLRGVRIGQFSRRDRLFVLVVLRV